MCSCPVMSGWRASVAALERPAGAGSAREQSAERPVDQIDRVRFDALREDAGRQVRAPPPQDLTGGIDQWCRARCRRDRMVDDHAQVPGRTDHAMGLAQELFVVVDQVEQADRDEPPRHAGPDERQVRRPADDDRAGRSGSLQQLVRQVDADHRSADGAHALALATADIHGGAIGSLEQFGQHVMRVGRLRRVVADRIDPPVGEVVPGVRHRSGA